MPPKKASEKEGEAEKGDKTEKTTEKAEKTTEKAEKTTEKAEKTTEKAEKTVEKGASGGGKTKTKKSSKAKTKKSTKSSTKKSKPSSAGGASEDENASVGKSGVGTRKGTTMKMAAKAIGMAAMVRSSTARKLTEDSEITGGTAAAAPAPEDVKPTKEKKSKVEKEPKIIQRMEIAIELPNFNAFIEDPNTDLRKSGRWPIVFDDGDRVATFLRYRNTNLLNFTYPEHMEPDRIRLAILGALRAGKPVVFDLQTISLEVAYPKLVERLDAVKPGLMNALIKRDILKDDYYMKLVKEDDIQQLKTENFAEKTKSDFKVILVTGKIDFTQDIVRHFYIVIVQ